MIVVSFWMKYSVRPMHIFGTLGLVNSLLGGIILAYLSFLKIAYSASIGNRPLL